MIGINPACVELARHFLTSEPIAVPISDAQAAANLYSLAAEIQIAVEDWFAEQERAANDD